MELKELYKTTLLAAADFQSKEINNKRNQKVFLKHTTFIANELQYFDLHDLKIYIEEKIFFLKEDIKWWNFSRINPYELSAYELSLDICNSFLIRFVDGGGSENTSIVKRM